MPIMRNWFHFAAVHRDNIRDVRIQFESQEDVDHNEMYQHKIGSPVVLGISQGDKNISHFIDATVLAVRFSERVCYDIAVPVGNSGVMAVMKMISGSNLRSPDAVYEPEPEPIVEKISPLSLVPKESVETNEAEELSPIGCVRFPETYFGEQVSDMPPRAHYVKVKSLKISGAMQSEENHFQIGDEVIIPNSPNPMRGLIYAINVSQHFSYDIAVPTRDGYYAIHRDIDAEYIEAANPTEEE
ncbi:hypothetical protein HOU08_gp028 [Dickeya phage vB_DsoM_JA29]|uniref:Uncharacterized protein n=1 Tax=Dickeya phage vB_DsoM_JA29 TaxID=2283031 RepID=A0A384ZX00_9CAUD|nr:hypothetical protein HOU08_gp028 [Dickeya phage vB_DsoM_JA29]AXG66754.1 hypothetical protein JA29_028 [Dickeya phage vB_DsoM_JA29]